MTERRQVDASATVWMVALCAIWGLQQVAIKAAAPAMAPVAQVALRSGVAALVVLVLVLARREGAAMRGGAWRPGLVVGLFFALEFLFVAEGLRFTSASHMAIFLYTAPIFAAVGLHLRLPAERLSVGQWLGIAVAFVGVGVSFAGRGGAAGGQAWIGDLLGLAAGAAWGSTTLAVRFSRLSEAPATVTLLFQLVGAFILLALVALASGQTTVTPTPLLGVSLLFQIVGVSLFSFLAWFALLRRYLASRLGVLSFLTPLFGVGFGVGLLGEQLDAPFIVGALLVLAGILIVSGKQAFIRSKPATLLHRSGYPHS